MKLTRSLKPAKIAGMTIVYTKQYTMLPIKAMNKNCFQYPEGFKLSKIVLKWTSWKLTDLDALMMPLTKLLEICKHRVLTEYNLHFRGEENMGAMEQVRKRNCEASLRKQH